MEYFVSRSSAPCHLVIATDVGFHPACHQLLPAAGAVVTLLLLHLKFQSQLSGLFTVVPYMELHHRSDAVVLF